MLFHVVAKHNYENCPGVHHGPESDEVNQMSKWFEGNESVKVLGVWPYNVSHTTYAVLESLDMQSVTNLLRPQMSFGDVQVLPVVDGIDMRKARGHWGK